MEQLYPDKYVDCAIIGESSKQMSFPLIIDGYNFSSNWVPINILIMILSLYIKNAYKNYKL